MTVSPEPTERGCLSQTLVSILAMGDVEIVLAAQLEDSHDLPQSSPTSLTLSARNRLSTSHEPKPTAAFAPTQTMAK